MHDVYVLSANGRAAAGNEFGYPPGEKHALLILLRQQPGSEADWIAAEVAATVRGWYELVFSEASTVPPQNLSGLPERAVEAYRQAMENGSALVAVTVSETTVNVPPIRVTNFIKRMAPPAVSWQGGGYHADPALRAPTAPPGVSQLRQLRLMPLGHVEAGQFLKERLGDRGRTFRLVEGRPISYRVGGL